MLSKFKFILIDNFPTVCFSYNPQYIDDMLKGYQPKWVFMDLGDGEKDESKIKIVSKLKEKKFLLLQRFVIRYLQCLKSSRMKILKQSLGIH